MKLEPVVLDTDHLRPRIQQRLLEIEQSIRSAAAEVGLAESSIRNLMNGSSKSPQLSTLVRIARALKVEPDWFLESAIHKDDEVSGPTSRVDFTDWYKPKMTELKNLSTKQKSERINHTLNNSIGMMYPAIKRDGSYIVDFAETARMFVDKPKLPDMLLFKQYMFWVRNNCMEPVYRKNDKVLVDPTYPLVVGEDYIFTKIARGDQPHTEAKAAAWLARLDSYDEEYFEVRVLNPKNSFRLPRSEWPWAHAIAARFFKALEEDEEGAQSGA